MCGVVEWVNRLVYVKPVKARYAAEVGDVVVGRVRELQAKRWKLDLKARQDGILMLSSVNLPDDVQRRRTWEDELNMRTFFAEGDLVCAEVQSLFQDGAVVLHTRSRKYGKLEAGQLAQVPPTLVRRLKQHFVPLADLGLYLVLGCNGFVWVGTCAPSGDDKAGEDWTLNKVGRWPPVPGVGWSGRQEVENCWLTFARGTPQDLGAMTADDCHRVCRAANAVRALGDLCLPVDPDSVAAAYRLSQALGLGVAELGGEAFRAALAAQAADGRAGAAEPMAK